MTVSFRLLLLLLLVIDDGAVALVLLAHRVAAAAAGNCVSVNFVACGVAYILCFYVCVC